MKKLALIFICLALVNTYSAKSQTKEGDPTLTEIWEPQPAKVTPGERPQDPPSDAIVLFSGKGLSAWKGEDGKPAPWKVEEGAFTVVPGSGNIYTQQKFGDVQLHIEWRTPPLDKVVGEGQDNGNSGIFFQNRYELQVLNNFNSKTYANGQAGSIYKQLIPLVNASKPPANWQTYDVIFKAPRFGDDDHLKEPARITVLHNGVLVQNNVALWGKTEYIGIPTYKAHGPESLRLQDHGNPVSYRNIWIREL